MFSQDLMHAGETSDANTNVIHIIEQKVSISRKKSQLFSRELISEALYISYLFIHSV